MANWRSFLAKADHPAARLARWARDRVRYASVPAPRVVVYPLAAAYVAARGCWFFVYRVLVCEPFLKSYCTSYGRRLRTGVYLHWITGKGDLVLGDDVLVDGKVSISFAARFADRPVLRVGDRTEIGHGCAFAVGKRIEIGADCRFPRDTVVMDSNGHPVTDAEARRLHRPPDPDEVRPVVIGNNVWVGMRSMILPGTVLGDGCVVAAGSVVRGRFPPYTLIAGNPARRVASLDRLQAAAGDKPAAELSPTPGG